MSAKARAFRRHVGGDLPAGPRSCWRGASTPNKIACGVCGTVPTMLHMALRGAGRWCPACRPNCNAPEAA
jgi:hypothetical protein